jgi:hypothetical protein
VAQVVARLHAHYGAAATYDADFEYGMKIERNQPIYGPRGHVTFVRGGQTSWLYAGPVSPAPTPPPASVFAFLGNLGQDFALRVTSGERLKKGRVFVVATPTTPNAGVSRLMFGMDTETDKIVGVSVYAIDSSGNSRLFPIYGIAFANERLR